VAILSERRLREALRAHNPWWASGIVPRGVPVMQPRSVDARLAQGGGAALLVGARGSGKTATLFRLLDGWLRAGRNPRSAVYLPLDHPLFRLEPLGPLVDRALQFAEPAERPLLLLDGLQALAEWPTHLLDVVRTRPGPRIVGAASVEPRVEDPALEVHALPPLRFAEFCALRGIPDLAPPPLELLEPRVPPEPESADDHLYGRVLDPALADFLVRGGFPAAALERDLSAAQANVREGVVARAIYRDLPAVEGIASLAGLERVLLAALLRSGAPLPLEAFADALELDARTVARYIDHLQRAFLLRGLKNFAAASDRSRSVLLPADPSLYNALLDAGPGVLADPEARRMLLYAAVLAHVEPAARARGLDVAYFREGDLAAELVLVGRDGAVPILLPEREEPGDEEAAVVERLLRRLHARHVFVVSRGRPRRASPLSFFESVVHLPAAYFLYALTS
jgi:predicted AAA+ superfamily ATPase